MKKLCLLLTMLSSAPSFAGVSIEAGELLIHGQKPTAAVYAVWPGAQSVGHDLQNFSYECGLFGTQAYHLLRENIGAQCMLIDNFERFDLGIGGAYMQHTDLITGSRLNFSLLARFKFNDHWGLTWNHVSNAGFAQPNLGRDMLRLRYAF